MISQYRGTVYGAILNQLWRYETGNFRNMYLFAMGADTNSWDLAPSFKDGAS